MLEVGQSAPYKLGKQRPKIDHRTFKLSNYLEKAALPPPPEETSWIMKPTGWPMYGNDVLGDCVEATGGHTVGQWTYYAGGSEELIDEGDIIRFYSDAGGYVPGDPSTDNGTFMLNALNVWRQKGIGGSGHRIGAYMSVDFRNRVEVMQAIQLFGNINLGIQLPISAQGQSAWTVAKGGTRTRVGAPGSWGGHCIPVMAASPITLSCITWGQRLKMSWNFFEAYADEAYVVLSTEWIAPNGTSPSGFNLAQLQADLAQL